MKFVKIETNEVLPCWIYKAYKIVKYKYCEQGGTLFKKDNYRVYHKFYDHKLKMYVSGNRIYPDISHYNTLAEAKKAILTHIQEHPEILKNTARFY